MPLMRSHDDAVLQAIGSDDGEVLVFELMFATIHSLFQEFYAYRYMMTEAVIHHLTSGDMGK